MKNAVKYLVLGVSCVICFVMLVLMVALLLDIGSLTYPATLILPMISYTLFIGGFILLTVWAFKFSSDKPHKTFLIISLSVFLVSTLVFISANIVNPIISTPKEKVCFDFTSTDLADRLLGYSIDLTSIDETDSKNEKSKIFISQKDIYTNDEDVIYPSVHYNLTCDKLSDEVQSVSCYIDSDTPNATERFFFHLFAIASSIDASVDTREISKSIITDNGDIEGVYIGEQFIANVYCLSDEYHAYIKPTENTKGD